MEDCQKALQLDSTLVKAHFFLGQALTELENYDDAIVSLKTGTSVFLHVYKLKIILSCDLIVSPHSRHHNYCQTSIKGRGHKHFIDAMNI